MTTGPIFRTNHRHRAALPALAGLLMLGALHSRAPEAPQAPLVPIKVAGARWIELSPVVVAANSFYAQKLTVPSGGVASITRGEADLATNAETQLLRESVNNPDLRIIMTVSESFYRLVGRRSAGINKLADLKGKRVLVPRLTSAQYYLVAMLRSAGLKEEDVTLVSMPAAAGGRAGEQVPQCGGPGPRRCGCHCQPSNRSPKSPSTCWARTPSCCRIARCTARRSTCTPGHRTSPTRKCAAPSWPSVARRRPGQQGAAEGPQALPGTYIQRDRLQRRGNRLGLAGNAIPREDHPGHAGRAGNRRDLGRQGEQSRAAQGRAELAKFIDRSVVEEALASR